MRYGIRGNRRLLVMLHGTAFSASSGAAAHLTSSLAAHLLFRAQMEQRYTDAIEPRYGRLPCPVTILFPEGDQWIPIARGRTLAARIAEVRFYAMRLAGHLVQEDAPGAIVAAFAAQYGSQRERSGA